jgi:predicted nucleic acid-binding protein
MILFLDTSTILAGCGSATGASRFIVENAAANDWQIIVSPYVLAEVESNLPDLPPSWMIEWRRLHSKFRVVPDVLTLPHSVVFSAAKDKPVLFSAYASAEILIVLDRTDFAGVIADGFYGLKVMRPGTFLRNARNSGMLKHPL